MKKFLFNILTIITISVLPFSACTAENGKTKADTSQQNVSETEKTHGTVIPPVENPTDETAFLFENKDGAITITGLNDETLTEIVIPSEINGLPVRAIKEDAFINKKNLRALSVPASVEKMEYGCLSGCSALTTLTLPFTGEKHKTEKGLKDYNFGYIFGETPFSGGKETMQFYHKDSMDAVEMVYYYIPSSLKTVTITGIKNTHIPYGTFYNCVDIDNVILGKNITDIGAFAFSGVVGKIEWNEPQIKTIGEHAFEDFKGEELTIPDGVNEIKRSAYSSCVNVKSFEVPDSVSDIDIYAFAYCYELQSITIGNGVEILPVETFYFCINLKTVSLPEGLKRIEDGAFDSCKALTSIEIPSTVTRINANAFKNCAKLKTAAFKNTDGWRYYGLDSSGDYFSADIISNSTTAAKYLTDTFRDYIWERTI